MLPFGTASSPTLHTYTRVGNRATTSSSTAATYLASTTCPSVRGLVSSSSMVPVRLSSLKLRMVTAGSRNRNTQGAMKKSGARSA